MEPHIDIHVRSSLKLPLFPCNRGWVINPSVGVYIPITGIPIKGMDDHPQHREWAYLGTHGHVNAVANIIPLTKNP